MQGRARLFSVVLGGSRRSSTLEVDSIHNACTSIFAVAMHIKEAVITASYLLRVRAYLPVQVARDSTTGAR